jgi:hypothetical protein
MHKSTRISRPIDTLSNDAGVIGLRANLDTLPSRELLDQFAALFALPESMRDASATRITLIRDILLDRLEAAS